jgi:SAM-dependent methyltransferase
MSELPKPSEFVEAFTRLYDDPTSDWGGNSGPGSTPFFTVEYRAFLERFIFMNGIRTVVDIGCGDWQFSKHINFDGATYIGFDVVPSVVARNQEAYGGHAVAFRQMPLDLDTLPCADLLIMKDVLQHFPNAEILRFRDRVFYKYKYKLLTNSYQKFGTAQNVDIPYGGFRSLDLAAPPFAFSGAYVVEFSSPVWERIRTFLYF